ncbi:MAG: Replicative helicase, partial [Bacteroidota bacterium]|nr:Replicative helicase [Bacteroidota bacterium]
MAIISIDKIDDSKSRQYKAGRKKTGEGSTAIGSRVPPHSNQAELAVLGSVMIDRAAIAKVIEILKPEYFYS